MLDYKSIPLPPSQMADADENHVSDDVVLKVATGMSWNGYRFSAASTCALTEVLSNKSVVLIGEVGTGKSLFFKALSEYTDGLDRMTGKPVHPYKFAVVRLGLAATHHFSEVEEFVKYHDFLPLVLDDLGSETVSVEYGQKMEVADMILQLREMTNAPTHIISNYGEDLLAKRYGNRVLDRMHHAIPPIVFLGDSGRSDNGKIPLTSTEWYRMFGFWQKRNAD